LNYFSEDEEREIGFNTSAQMNLQLMIYDDPEIQNYIDFLGGRLVAASRNPQLQCRFFVVNTREVNAFALPGCFHGAKRLSRQLMITSLVEGVSEAVGAKSQKWANIIATAGGYGGMLAALKYSRDDEHQADALGVETSAAAGYDPHDLAKFFRLMEPGSVLDPASRIMGILSTIAFPRGRPRYDACQRPRGYWRYCGPESVITLIGPPAVGHWPPVAEPHPSVRQIC